MGISQRLIPNLGRNYVGVPVNNRASILKVLLVQKSFSRVDDALSLIQLVKALLHGHAALDFVQVLVNCFRVTHGEVGLRLMSAFIMQARFSFELGWISLLANACPSFLSLRATLLKLLSC